MKKIILLLIFVCMIGACGNKNEKFDNADILIFTQHGCSHCEKAMDFINNRLKVKNPALTVEQVDVSYDRDNIMLLKKYLHRYNFEGETVGTPIIIFNKQLLMGWNLENKVKLQKAFEFNLE